MCGPGSLSVSVSSEENIYTSAFHGDRVYFQSGRHRFNAANPTAPEKCRAVSADRGTGTALLAFVGGDITLTSNGRVVGAIFEPMFTENGSASGTPIEWSGEWSGSEDGADPVTWDGANASLENARYLHVEAVKPVTSVSLSVTEPFYAGQTVEDMKTLLRLDDDSKAVISDVFLSNEGDIPLKRGNEDVVHVVLSPAPRAKFTEQTLCYCPEEYKLFEAAFGEETGTIWCTFQIRVADGPSYPVWVNGERFGVNDPVIQCGGGTAALDVSTSPWTLTLSNAEITKVYSTDYTGMSTFSSYGIYTTRQEMKVVVEGLNRVNIRGNNKRIYGIGIPNAVFSGGGSLEVNVYNGRGGMPDYAYGYLGDSVTFETGTYRFYTDADNYTGADWVRGIASGSISVAAATVISSGREYCYGKDEGFGGTVTYPEDAAVLVGEEMDGSDKILWNKSKTMDNYKYLEIVTSNVIKSVNVMGFANPCAGITAGSFLAQLTVPENAGYTIEGRSVIDTEGTAIADEAVLQARSMHRFELKLAPVPGYVFGNTTQALVNGETDLVDATLSKATQDGCFCLVTTEFATTKGTDCYVWVNGLVLNGNRKTVSCGEGTATLNERTTPYTLTLNNAEITRPCGGTLSVNAGIYVSGDLNVVVSGDCRIDLPANTAYDTQYGIYAGGDLTLSGGGGDNRLTVSVGSGRSSSTAIKAVGSLTVENDLRLAADSEAAALSFVSQNISSPLLLGSADRTENAQREDLERAQASSGSVVLTAQTETPCKTVLLMPELDIHIAALNADPITYDNLEIALGGGTARFDPDKWELTLDNAEIVSYGSDRFGFSKSYYQAAIYTQYSDLTIRLVGNNSITYSGVDFTDNRVGIFCGGALNIEGTGSLSIDMTGCSAPENRNTYGIFVNTSLNVKEAVINIENNGIAGIRQAYYSNDMGWPALLFENADISVEGNEEYGLLVYGKNSRIDGGSYSFRTGGSNAVFFSGEAVTVTGGANVTAHADGASGIGFYCSECTVEGDSELTACVANDSNYAFRCTKGLYTEETVYAGNSPEDAVSIDDYSSLTEYLFFCICPNVAAGHIWVNGEALSDGEPVSCGLGTAVYSDPLGALILDNAEITEAYVFSDDREASIYTNLNSLEIRLVGENSIEGCIYGIYSSCSLTFTGDGSLDITMSEGSGTVYGIYTLYSLTVDRTKINVSYQGTRGFEGMYAVDDLILTGAEAVVFIRGGASDGIVGTRSITIDESSVVTIDAKCSGTTYGIVSRNDLHVADYSQIDITAFTTGSGKMYGIFSSGLINMEDTTLNIVAGEVLFKDCTVISKALNGNACMMKCDSYYSTFTATFDGGTYMLQSNQAALCTPNERCTIYVKGETDISARSEEDCGILGGLHLENHESGSLRIVGITENSEKAGIDSLPGFDGSKFSAKVGDSSSGLAPWDGVTPIGELEKNDTVLVTDKDWSPAPVYVNGTELTEDNGYSVQCGTGWATLHPAAVPAELVLHNAQITGTNFVAGNDFGIWSEEPIKIILEGENKVTVDDSWSVGIGVGKQEGEDWMAYFSPDDLTVAGTGKLIVTAAGDAWYGIWAKNVTFESGECDIRAEGEYSYALNAALEQETFSGGAVVTLTGGAAAIFDDPDAAPLEIVVDRDKYGEIKVGASASFAVIWNGEDFTDYNYVSFVPPVEEDAVWVNGEKLTENKTVTCGSGTAKLDTTTTPWTLTLTNAKINNYSVIKEGYLTVDAAIITNRDLRIIVTGKASVYPEKGEDCDLKPAIYAAGNGTSLIFEGTGTLIASTYFRGSSIEAIRTSGHVSFSTGNFQIVGLWDTDVAISGGSVTIKDGAEVALHGGRNALPDGLPVTYPDGYTVRAANDSKAFEVLSDDAYRYDTVHYIPNNGNPKVWVNGEPFAEKKTEIQCGSGTATLDTTTEPWTLTLNNAQITNYSTVPNLEGNDIAGIYTERDLKIVTAGTCSVSFNKSATGTDTVCGVLARDEAFSSGEDYDLTFEGSGLSITADGATAAVSARNVSFLSGSYTLGGARYALTAKKLTLNADRLALTGTDDAFSRMPSFSANVSDDYAIAHGASSDSMSSCSLGGVTREDKAVSFTFAAKNIDAWVNGVRFTNTQKTIRCGDGAAGSSGYTLTLHNARITQTNEADEANGIYRVGIFSKSSLTVILEGENTVSCQSNGQNDAAHGISTGSYGCSVYMEGSGSLDITVTGDMGEGIHTSGLVFNGRCTVTADLPVYGYESIQFGDSETILAGNTNALYMNEKGSAPGYASEDFCILAGNNSGDASKIERPTACEEYEAHKYLHIWSGSCADLYKVRVNGKAFTPLEETIGCGGGIATFDETGPVPVLTLTNAEITQVWGKDEGSIAGIMFYREDDLIIELVGENTIILPDYTDSAHYIGSYQGICVPKNLTLTGRGSLTVSTGEVNYNKRWNSYCVCAGGSVTVMDTTLDLLAGYGNWSQGIDAGNEIIIDRSDVTAAGDSFGLYSANDFVLAGGALEYTISCSSAKDGRAPVPWDGTRMHSRSKHITIKWNAVLSGTVGSTLTYTVGSYVPGSVLLAARYESGGRMAEVKTIPLTESTLAGDTGLPAVEGSTYKLFLTDSNNVPLCTEWEG